jgi:hypothetical protein
MKKIAFAIAALAALASQAQADGFCSGPFCQKNNGRGAHGYPTFQAAPWYLYWPYNQHFMTPAPLMGAYYAPPSHGGTLVSPYFPAPQAAAPQPAR